MTDKQASFVEAYLANGFNATRAAETAGYAHPGSQGSRLLQNVEIQEKIQERLSQAAMQADEVLFHIAEIARSNMGDYLKVIEGIRVPYVDLNQAKDRLHLIRTYKNRPDSGVTIQLYDKLRALELLARHHRLLTDRVEVEDRATESLAQAINRGLDQYRKKHDP